jgi:hypothetical protein
VLAKKGFSQFTFCYDWRWRAEEIRGRSLCPATRWCESAKKLHDDLSSDILALLDLRVIIVGGTCARLYYRKIEMPGRQTMSTPLL